MTKYECLYYQVYCGGSQNILNIWTTSYQSINKNLEGDISTRVFKLSSNSEDISSYNSTDSILFLKVLSYPVFSYPGWTAQMVTLSLITSVSHLLISASSGHWRAVTATCDLSVYWSEERGDMAWPTKTKTKTLWAI